VSSSPSFSCRKSKAKIGVEVYGAKKFPIQHERKNELFGYFVAKRNMIPQFWRIPSNPFKI